MPRPATAFLVRRCLLAGLLSLLPAALHAAAPLRVVAFNVENGLYAAGSESHDNVSRILKRIDADVVGLCELVEWTRSGSYIGDSLNFPALATELGLPYHAFDTGNSEHRAGIASRYPIDFLVWVHVEGMTRRIPLVRIAVPGAPNGVWVAMLHLKARHDSDLDQHIRAIELYHLREAIRTHCDLQSDAIIVMGTFNMVSPADLNFETGSYAGVSYPLPAPKDADGYFVDESIFKLDARHAGPDGENWNWRSDGVFPDTNLNHIMVNAHVRSWPVASEVYDVRKDAAGLAGLTKYGPRPLPNASYGSDHLPIFADLRVDPVPGVPPLQYTKPTPGINFTAGSDFYVNAKVAPFVKHVSFLPWYSSSRTTQISESTRLGETFGGRVSIVASGDGSIISEFTDYSGRTSFFGVLYLHSQPLLEYLPQVEMLPLSPQDRITPGSPVTLRAEAFRPFDYDPRKYVEFYANGVYIGTGRHVSGTVHELSWTPPSPPQLFEVTAMAVKWDHSNFVTGREYHSASISDKSVNIDTRTPQTDEASLAAGRTAFEVVAKNLTWPEARDDAEARGGRLAVFPTGAMYDRMISGIRRTFGDAIWLGLTDEAEEGVWRWIDGSPLADSRWQKEEPNNFGGDEDYAHIWWGGDTWNDSQGTAGAYLLEKFPRAIADLPVNTGGVPWYVSTAESVDGKDSAMAMTFHGDSTWREYTFTGPVEVSFHWRVSSAPGDVFSYALNGTTRASISGETAWSRQALILPAGTHTIRWTYSKDAAGSAGADAGFLDGLEARPLAPPLGVQLSDQGAFFSVWAPNATTVSLVGDFNGWSETLMTRDEETGHWSATVAGVETGHAYQYLIRWPGNESGRLKNDPRADWIRDGRSVVYDHAAFDWGVGFVPRDGTTGLVYELHIGTFHNPSPKTRRAGTFDDAIERLDYLAQLGVDVIALMPVTEYDTPTSWGYNPAYLFAVENDYGGPDGLKRFVRAAHERGIRVQLDVVHNHYLQGDYPAEDPGLLEFDGPEDIYFYGRHTGGADHPDQPKRAATYWGPRPDYSQTEVRRYIEDNTRHWLEKYRIDGFRWDSPKNILGYDSDGESAEPDTLLPEAKAMMAGINRMIHEEFPGRWSIAEEPNLLVAGAARAWGQFYLDAAVTSLAESFDGHWQTAFHDHVTSGVAGSTTAVLEMLERIMDFSEPPATRVIFTDNHDQAGDLNRKRRLPHRLGEADPGSLVARRKALLNAVITLTAPGQPMLLMGQEFHATGAFTDRRPMDWSAAAQQHRLFRAYRDLADLRREFDSIRDTRLGRPFGANNALRIGRYWRGGDVVVAFNNSPEIVETPLTFPSGGDWYVRLNTDSSAYSTDFTDIGPEDGRVTVTALDNRQIIMLAPFSAIVFAKMPAADPGNDDANDLPDAWETITGVSNPEGDEDGDGLTNRQEFESGLDPRTFNPDAVVGTFNDWDPLVSPLADSLQGGVRAHLQFFPRTATGSFRWLLKGVFYGSGSEEGLVAGGAPLVYEAPAGSYLLFAAGETAESATLTALDPANPLDADGNALDDRWQAHYGVADAGGDTDGDGLDNLSEFRRGSNPLAFDRTPALVGSALPLRWLPDAPDLKMTWAGKRGRWEWIGEFPAGPLEFKFAMGPGWTGDNHGRSSRSGQTDISGGPESNLLADLPIAGRYRFAFNEPAGTYHIEAFPRMAGWREHHNLPGDRGWSEDSDDDGLSDLAEYALGGDPQRQDNHQLLPRAQIEAEERDPNSQERIWVFRWTQTDDAALSINPLLSSDLHNQEWIASPAEPDTDQSRVPSGHIRKVVRFPGTTDRAFLRLRIFLPEESGR